MSYIKNNLLPNEEVIFQADVHPVVFLRALVMLFFTLLLAVCATAMIAQNPQLTGSFIPTLWCLAGITLFGTISLAVRALVYKASTEFAVTNQRIIAKRGFIRRSTLEVMLPKAESVSIDQDILGRMLGYGSLTVVGTGGTRETIRLIDDPVYARHLINRVINAARQSGSTRTREEY